MLRKPHWLALAILALMEVILLSLPARTSSQVKVVISAAFLPLFGVATSVAQGLDRTTALILPKRFLITELDRLRAENEQLRVQVSNLQQAREENTQLRAQLQWPGAKSPHYRPARVVGRDPANWWQAITIDLGLRDGLRANLAVITPEGLVGRTAEVGYDRTQVLLVGDSQCKVSALIEETRDHGVLEPSSSTLDSTLVQLTYLPNSDKIAPAQRVITSGLGAIFPKGILIGQVTDTQSIGNGLYTLARVKLAVNMSRLEHVWVWMPSQ